MRNYPDSNEGGSLPTAVLGALLHRAALPRRLAAPGVEAPRPTAVLHARQNRAAAHRRLAAPEVRAPPPSVEKSRGGLLFKRLF